MERKMTDIQKLARQARDTLQRAVDGALDRKRRLGQYAIIYQNGKLIRLEPDQITKQQGQR